jgi:hypothetical protein
MNEGDVSDEDEKPKRIRFSYIKSNFFRVIHVDGAVGAPAPTGFIRMTLYNERIAVPPATVHQISAEGGVGAELREERVTKDGIVREMETDVVLTREAAVMLQNWLAGQIVKLDRLTKGDADV